MLNNKNILWIIIFIIVIIIIIFFFFFYDYYCYYYLHRDSTVESWTFEVNTLRTVRVI